MRTVYVDVLVGMNLVIDYFLLLAAGLLAHVRAGRVRLLLSALLGAAGSLLILLPRLHFLLLLLARIALAFAMTAAAFGFGGIKKFLLRTGSLFAVTLLFGGAMLAVRTLWNPAGMVLQNGAVYFSLSPVVLLLSTAAFYGLFRLIRAVMGRRMTQRETMTLEITLEGQTAVLTALLDTGNHLRDALSDTPVLIAEYRAVRTLIPRESAAVFAGTAQGPPEGEMASRFRCIPYTVIGSGGLLPAFCCDGIRVLRPDGPHRLGKRIVAVCSQNMDGVYNAVAGPDFFDDL